ncbi:MAG: hypothetical protein JWR09_3903 [Mucilaginibacter sp.]|nr:hypothetical protein [Mucilaginibacter sp.]
MFKPFTFTFIALFYLGTASGQNYKVLNVFGTVSRPGGQNIQKGDFLKGSDPVAYHSPKDGLRVFSDGKIYLLTPPGSTTTQPGKLELLLSHFIRKATTGSLSGKYLQVPYCYLPLDTLATFSSTTPYAWYTGQHLVVPPSSKAAARHAMLLLGDSNQKLSINGTPSPQNAQAFDFDLGLADGLTSDTHPSAINIVFYNDADHIASSINLSVFMLSKAILLKKIQAIYKDADTRLFCPQGAGHKDCLKSFIEENLIASCGLVISQPVDQIVETYLSQNE